MTIKISSHIEENAKLYKQKCQLMLSEMEKNFHKDVTFTRPEGGMFIMAYLPEGYDSAPFVQDAIKNSVACVPGTAFMPDDSVSNAFRLNFSTSSDEDIIKGIEILGKMTHDLLDK